MNRRVHAFGDDALGHDDAVGLSARLAAGEVTAAALVEAAIARIERVDPNLGAMAYRSYDEARRQAAQVGLELGADGREPVAGGLLRGIPALVKDNVEFAGMPAQHGTDAYVAAPARADGDLARMWRATGLIALGKTRLSEYGFSASCEHARLGPVRNPWDPRFTAGASSSGSSALVAAGAVPLAHGNDGGGSIRIPAAVNGLVGLKPTRGRTAQDALFRQLPVRIISDGVLTRSVRDTAAFFAAAERVWRNPDLPPIGWVRRPSGPGFRVGLVTSSVTRRPSGEVVDAVERCGALLESLGHLVVPIDPPAPASFVDDFVNYWSQLALATVRTGRLQHGSSWQPARLDEFTVGLARHARRSLHRLPGAIARLQRIGAHSAHTFERYDVVVMPTLGHATPALGHLDPAIGYEVMMERLQEWVMFTPYQNATGEPAVSLPLAHDANGLPLGLMFTAARGQEARLLGLALQLEEAAPWARIDAESR